LVRTFVAAQVNWCDAGVRSSMVTHDLGEDAPGGRRVLVQQMLQRQQVHEDLSNNESRD
jgi:hypothetical protein